MKNRKQMLAAIQEALKRKTIRQSKETKAVADLVLYAIDLAIDEEERMDAMVAEYERNHKSA